MNAQNTTPKDILEQARKLCIVHVNIELKCKLESGEAVREALGAQDSFKEAGYTFCGGVQEALSAAETFEQGPEWWLRYRDL